MIESGPLSLALSVKRGEGTKKNATTIPSPLSERERVRARGMLL
jgi:hypothetical protein